MRLLKERRYARLGYTARIARLFVVLFVVTFLLVDLYPLVGHMPVWISPALEASFLFVGFVAILSSAAIFWFLLGLRSIRTGTSEGRGWGLLFLLAAVQARGIALEILPRAALRDQGEVATGLALGAFIAVASFRRSKPIEYPRSRFWLWAVWVFALALTAWMAVLHEKLWS